MSTARAGHRIRAARRARGMTQVALAAAAGISPSYLNLIEHNRRRAAGQVQVALAQALGLTPADLSEGDAPAVVRDLRRAAREAGRTTPEGAEAFAARFADWADLLVALAAQVRAKRATLAAITDRLTHDPFLAENVHAMLSHITAIRSTANILAGTADMVPAQQRAFHETIDAESVRLSATAKALADYLGAGTETVEIAVTAEEKRDAVLERYARVFPALDAAGEDATPAAAARARATIDEIAAEAEEVDGGATLLRAYLEEYASDARAMPLGAFADAARAADYDPAVLAKDFWQPVHAVFRRLAVLRRPQIAAPAFGLVVVSAAGYPVLRHPVQGFAPPRHGNACTLWPLFRAFAQPGRPLLDRIEFDNGARFVAYSLAEPRGGVRFGANDEDLRAAMLLRPRGDDAPGAAVGASCPICTRDCAARLQPSLVL